MTAEEVRAEVAGIIGVPPDTPWAGVTSILRQMVLDMKNHSEQARRRDRDRAAPGAELTPEGDASGPS